MTTEVKTAGLVAVLLAAAALGMAQDTYRSVAVIGQSTEQETALRALTEGLLQELTTRAALKVIDPGEDSTLPPPPDRRFDEERLLEWGREVGCRYVIYLRVDEQRIATRKQKSIPWVLSRYVVEGHLNGLYALIDLNRNKAVGTWDLATRLTGPRQWQVAADYPDDPDLQLSAPGRLVFLKQLEKKAVDEIMLALQPYLKGR